MPPEQLTTAYWIFGSIFAVLAIMFGLFVYVGRPVKKKTEAWQHHEDSLEWPCPRQKDRYKG
jgi:hypothetical protein